MVVFGGVGADSGAKPDEHQWPVALLQVHITSDTSSSSSSIYYRNTAALSSDSYSVQVRGASKCDKISERKWLSAVQLQLVASTSRLVIFSWE